MQRKPRFSGILLVAVLMVVVLLFVSLSPLVAASASKHVNYSDIYYYFQNQQVTSYRLDRNTNVLEMWLKEGKKPLPEDTSSTADLPSGGLLTNLSGSQDDDDELPANGGTVYVSYKLPYGGDFNTGKITEFVDAYNEANPDAPMIFDYVAVKTSVPWLEIIFYSVMLGSVGMLFMSMYRGGAGGGIMNVGRAKVKDQQESQRKATFADVAGADEEKEERFVLPLPKSELASSSKLLASSILWVHVFPTACCWWALRVLVKRCWPVPAQARRACRSTPSPALTSSKCTSVSVPPVCVTCLKKPKRPCRPSSLSMRSMPWAASAAPVWAAAMMNASRP